MNKKRSNLDSKEPNASSVLLKKKQSKFARIKFDISSAIWVLSCNDPVSIMTYKGIKYRLSLLDEYDVESVKALVRERGELFRTKVPIGRLNEWKVEMQTKSSKRPAWIRDLGDETQQTEAIEKLTVDDVFRSQFRIEKDSPPSSLEIIDWGLQHIERLRKSDFEVRAERLKKAQLWVVIVLGLVNIVISSISLFQQNQ